MDETIDDLFAPRARLLGAATVAAVGVAFWLATLWLYKRLRDRVGGVGQQIARVLFSIWTACWALVLSSLVVNTLDIDWLRDWFDGLVTYLPRLVVAGLIALVAWVLIRALAKPYGRWRVARGSAVTLLRVLVGLVFWVVVAFVATMALFMVAAQLEVTFGPPLNLMWLPIAIAGLIIDLRSGHDRVRSG